MDVKECSVCDYQIPIDDFPDHTKICQREKEEEQKSPMDMDSLDEQSDDDAVNAPQKYRSDAPINVQERFLFKMTKKSLVKDKDDQNQCFDCFRSIDDEKESVKITCPNEHVYCSNCFQKSMNIYARNNLLPRCHYGKCFYALSPHELQQLPMECSLMNKLKNSIQEKHRRKCSRCRFYVDAETDKQFDEHFRSCGDFDQCQFCFCPISKQDFIQHKIECENDGKNLIEKSTKFLSNRTKYLYDENRLFSFIRKEFIANGRLIDVGQLNNTLSFISPDCL